MPPPARRPAIHHQRRQVPPAHLPRPRSSRPPPRTPWTTPPSWQPATPLVRRESRRRNGRHGRKLTAVIEKTCNANKRLSRCSQKIPQPSSFHRPRRWHRTCGASWTPDMVDTITSTVVPERLPGRHRLVLAGLQWMLLILLLLILFKVTLTERHQVPASSNLPSQVQTTKDILLIGSVSIVATSTLLDALNAIDAVSPGCLLSPNLPPDETPPCYCLSL